jgi:hypothetical protein
LKLIGYRHSSHSDPLWPVPNSTDGRFHRKGQIAQYLCLHPLGPAAEMLRHQLGPRAVVQIREVVLSLWAIQVSDEGIIEITFDNCTDYSIEPAQLVADNYFFTQDLADGFHAGGLAGIKVPSAALPGTDNLVLFGPRVADDYLGEPVPPEELSTGHLTDYAHPSPELWPYVRWIGMPHSALSDWKSSGVYERFHDPIPAS